jgi:hypothetical protein
MPGSHAFTKRQKERQRQEKQREKEAKRRQRREERAGQSPAAGEDPDLAGIVPGPQPPAFEELRNIPADEPDDEGSRTA